MNRFCIIDGNAIIHRAYHAMPPMTTKDGTMVNAAYGFASMLLRTIEDLKPTHIAVAFDMAGGTFRDELYTEYKAKRVKADQDLYDQIPLVHQLVESFNIPIYEKEGYEADDLIGTVVQDKKLQKEMDEIVIVTGDRDLLQLVDDKVHVLLLRKGVTDMILMDAGEVEKLYGFGPDRVVDYKSIRGDASDNIPGVKGIGEKGATELIQKVGSLDEIYTKIGILKELGFKEGLIKKLEEEKENAYLSRKLATIETSVPDVSVASKDAVVHEFDRATVEELFRKFEFFSLLKRIPGAPKGEETSSKKQETKKSKHKEIVILETKKEIEAFVAGVKKEKRVVAKEVLAGSDPMLVPCEGILFIAGEETFFLPEKSIGDVGELFSSGEVLVIGHDLKELAKVLRLHNILLSAKIFDIMIASYVVNSSTRAHDLPSIVMRELDVPAADISQQTTLFGGDRERVAREIEHIEPLYHLFEKKLDEMNDRGLFETVEMALIPVLSTMEVYGIAVDTSTLGKMSKDVAKEIEAVSKKIWKEAGQEFNIASSVQLRDILFDTMGLPTAGIKKGKTGYSTASSELEKLREESPIIALVETYRELEKLRNTYIDTLPTLINPKTGRIHTHYNQAVASTGRLSSTDPNLQNIPIRTELGREIRNTFVAAPGCMLVSADYSQIELRIAASLAKDETMIEIFKRGEDIHRATAAAIHGVPLEQVDKEMRRSAKEVNFGVLYGMGSFGLASRTGLPQWQAKEFIDAYFKQFSGVRKYIDLTLEQAKKLGYVETLFGRRRYVPELLSDNFQLRNAGERMAVNMPIQGTAADLMKLAMIDVWKKVEGMPGVKLILQVHDELVLEVEKGKEEEIGAIVKKSMETVVTLNVPIEVEVHTGMRWGELK